MTKVLQLSACCMDSQAIKLKHMLLVVHLCYSHLISVCVPENGGASYNFSAVEEIDITVVPRYNVASLFCVFSFFCGKFCMLSFFFTMHFVAS